MSSTSSMLGLDADFDRRARDFAIVTLADVRECDDADINVRWLSGAPHLVIAFHLAETAHQPALAVRLTTMPSGATLSGDRLRRHIRTSLETYLGKHGVRLPDGFLP